MPGKSTSGLYPRRVAAAFGIVCLVLVTGAAPPPPVDPIYKEVIWRENNRFQVGYIDGGKLYAMREARGSSPAMKDLFLLAASRMPAELKDKVPHLEPKKELYTDSSAGTEP
jgi:hypothetical protein